jgi:hypothetical protein
MQGVKLSNWKESDKMRKLNLPKLNLQVKKTGIPYYDASRLIGTAHLFFGTADAEINDKGAYWEISGITLSREQDQIEWVIEKIAGGRGKTSTMERQEVLNKLFSGKKPVLYDATLEYFKKNIENQIGTKKLKMKAEYDVTLQTGTRGFDPLSKYEALAPRSTGESLKHYKEFVEEIVAATFGRGFSARASGGTRRQRENINILPVFSERFVIRGFLDYKRNFRHNAGGYVSAVFAALTILDDLKTKRLPILDFAFTNEVKSSSGTPVYSESGVLGFDKLCGLWIRAVEENDTNIENTLRQIRFYLEKTARTEGQKGEKQALELARWLAKFVSNPDIGSLVKIEHLKARILANKNSGFKYTVQQLFSSRIIIQQAGKMVLESLPVIPSELVKAVADTLSLDEKGWMNKFTRLENASTIDQLLSEVERIVSRGANRSSQIPKSLAGINSQSLQALSSIRDIKTFRTTKSIFLLQVLSYIKPAKEQPKAEQLQNSTIGGA